MKFLLNKTLLGLAAAIGFLGLTTNHAEARHYYRHHYYGYYGGPRVVYHSYYRPYVYDPYYYDDYAYRPYYSPGITFAFGGGYGHRYGHYGYYRHHR